MSRKVVEIPIEVWEFSLQDAEHIAALHRETLSLMNDNARLKAEVERLRKAGDNLARAADENGCHDNGDAKDLDDSIDRWNAAKEGKQP